MDIYPPKQPNQSFIRIAIRPTASKGDLDGFNPPKSLTQSFSQKSIYLNTIVGYLEGLQWL
jgi:hypothetical protein